MQHFLCAFLTEARAIIEYYGLKPVKDPAVFPIYLNEKEGISLTLSGMGKLSAAAAVSHARQFLMAGPSDVWLNVGIAGHGRAEQGTIFMAHHIIDEGSRQQWFPQFIFPVPCETGRCITLDQAGEDYQDCLFDMEASGFYSACIRFASVELIHCLKIVSDTPEQGLGKLNKETAGKLVSGHLQTIVEITNQLQKLSKEYHDTLKKPAAFEDISAHRHFTASEKIQLEKILRRWQILLPEVNACDIIAKNPDSKSILIELESKLNGSTFSYD